MTTKIGHAPEIRGDGTMPMASVTINWFVLLLKPVAFLGYRRYGRCPGRHLKGVGRGRGAMEQFLLMLFKIRCLDRGAISVHAKGAPLAETPALNMTML